MTKSHIAQVMSNVSETLNGRMVIRAMNCEQYFVKRHEEAMDNYTRMDFASQSLLNWGNLAGGCNLSLSLSLSLSSRALSRSLAPLPPCSILSLFNHSTSGFHDWPG